MAEPFPFRPETIEALLWAGITPPEFGRKTRCPQCSEFRKRPRHRCLAITETALSVRWFCFNRCGFEGAEEMPQGRGGSIDITVEDQAKCQ